MTIIGFNWYALCNIFWCCYNCTGKCMHECSYVRRTDQVNWWASGAANSCCYFGLKCGELASPMIISQRWCGNCWCCCWGYWRTGDISVCHRCDSSDCGAWHYNWHENRDLCNCHCSYQSIWNLFYNNYMCKPCSDCYFKPRGGTGGTWCDRSMSPYGFHHGTTNCFYLHFYNKSNNGTTCYFGGWPYGCISGGGCGYKSNEGCWMSKAFYLKILDPLDSTYKNELPLKYVAWNPFDGYVYMAIRSSEASQCGIFRVDPDSIRKFHGPHCGCTGQDDWCCGCVSSGVFYPCSNDLFAEAKIDWCRVSTWPTAWTDSKYFAAGSMCVSCLFRTEKCRWIMDLYNHTSGKWDSYSTADLWRWSITNDSSSVDPFALKVNDTLTVKTTADCRCIITSCNCFMANMDCSGLIDYKFNANQYERNGIVLSNGDRVMINNNSDQKVNAQIWGYEG